MLFSKSVPSLSILRGGVRLTSGMDDHNRMSVTVTGPVLDSTNVVLAH